MNNTILSPNSDNLVTPNSSDAINRYNFLIVNPETRKTPPVSLNDLDCFPNSSNQEETEALPSSVHLKPSKSQENPSTTNTLPIQGSIDSVVSTDSLDNYAKWKKLTLVAQSIQKFRSLKAEKIKSEGNLTQTIIETPCPKLDSDSNKGIMHVTAGDLQRSAINEFRYNASFFDALEIGSSQEIKYIRKALANDPKANFYEADDPQRLANKPNHRGYSPLYIACKNANIEVLKILIEFKANPYQLCNITSKYRESILTVAARWGHMEILTYLLTNKFNWSEKELRRAFESSLNKDSQKLVKQKLDKFKKPLLGRIFACSSSRHTGSLTKV